ncbi:MULTISPECIES: signal peptidase I [unclassified Streptomyces]|uniref:signal peptidase I n=1 Tax=unclassified Streptomyces TaxID=2593676 RepID=UPI0020256090|nr:MULTISPECIES: signal peptidase I [unclassified Streptomyces]MCX4547893.1 signal peptidase I [Streptomyces sp. NBC_01500]WSV53589.1 signal peptidase I [Streptomyces sp. NBC_01014]
MGNRGRARGSAESSGRTDLEPRPPGERALPTRAERRRLARKVKRRRRSSTVKEVPALLVFAVLIALVLKTFLVQAFVIPSGSMEETIRIGDRVLVDKLTPWFGSEPHRGDVVVFKDPGHWLPPGEARTTDSPFVVKELKQGLTFIGLLPSDDEQDLIKRVIGVGGDTVKCCDKNGQVTVNGVPLDEPYVHPGNPPSELTFDVKVPAGRLFVMGDHRSNSADSRFHLDGPYQGTVPVSGVVGRAVVIAWPFGHWSRLKEPPTFSSVTDASGLPSGAGGTSNSVTSQDRHPMGELPTPAELPLVMGVVGLRLIGRGRRHGVRSGCGGRGGRRTIRTRGAGGPARIARWWRRDRSL